MLIVSKSKAGAITPINTDEPVAIEKLIEKSWKTLYTKAPTTDSTILDAGVTSRNEPKIKEPKKMIKHKIDIGWKIFL